MAHNAQENQSVFLILINDEDQYSLWPAYRPVPLGWRQVGEPGPKDACLARIEALWTDMRPRSLKQQMAEVSE
jgi:MbtH protein